MEHIAGSGRFHGGHTCRSAESIIRTAVSSSIIVYSSCLMRPTRKTTVSTPIKQAILPSRQLARLQVSGALGGSVRNVEAS